MTDIDTLKLALELLDRQWKCSGVWSLEESQDVADALRQAIEQAEQATVKQSLTVEQTQPVDEPYGQVTVVRRPGCDDQHWFYRWPEPPYLDNAAECHTVYTTPPPRQPWVGLTPEEKNVLLDAFYGTDIKRLEAVEAKLKEKNT